MKQDIGSRKRKNRTLLYLFFRQSYDKITKVYKRLEGFKLKKHFFQKQVAGILTLLLLLSLFPGFHKASAEGYFRILMQMLLFWLMQKQEKYYMKKILIQVLGIASMTKMMTEYLLLEAIEEGKCEMGSRIFCK